MVFGKRSWSTELGSNISFILFIGGYLLTVEGTYKNNVIVCVNLLMREHKTHAFVILGHILLIPHAMGIHSQPLKALVLKAQVLTIPFMHIRVRNCTLSLGTNDIQDHVFAIFFKPTMPLFLRQRTLVILENLSQWFSGIVSICHVLDNRAGFSSSGISALRIEPKSPPYFFVSKFMDIARCSTLFRYSFGQETIV